MTLHVQLHPVRLLLKAPLTTAAGTVEIREGVVLGLSDGTHTGWGEAMPMPGVSHESSREAQAALEAATSALAPLDPDDPRFEELLDELASTPTVRAAVAGAGADLVARRAGRSLAELLVESPPRKILVNALVADPTPDAVAQAVVSHVSAGMTCVKLKVAGPYSTVDLDVARVAAARDAAGPTVELRIDANGGWDVSTAVEALRRMVVHDVSFCEEPSPGIEAIAEVAARAVVPVAVDESAGTPGELEAALAAGVGVVIVKPQALGGPDVAVRLIDRVADAGVATVVTSFIDSAVGVAHAAHVAAASGSTLAHGLATSALLARDVAEPLRVEGGRLSLVDEPGIGVVPGFAADAGET